MQIQNNVFRYIDLPTPKHIHARTITQTDTEGDAGKRRRQEVGKDDVRCVRGARSDRWAVRTRHGWSSGNLLEMSGNPSGPQAPLAPANGLGMSLDTDLTCHMSWLGLSREAN